MEQQKQAEIEANRLEELQSGGYIPPANDIAAENFNVDLEEFVYLLFSCFSICNCKCFIFWSFNYSSLTL